MNKFCLSALFILPLLMSCTTDPDDDDDSWDAAKVCPETGTNSYGMPNRGTFTDERDGQVYKYTTIGKQVWMAQNLNYDVEKDACYYEEDDCRTMGRVYYPTERPCPAGWHLPSFEEWHQLFDVFGGEDAATLPLKATHSWTPLNPGDESNGTDDCGFSATFAINGRETFGFQSGFLTSTITYNSKGEEDLVWTVTFRSYGRISMVNTLCRESSTYVRCLKD